MANNKVTFTHNGKEYTMTLDEIEAAYRYQDREYHKQDVFGRVQDNYGYAAAEKLNEGDLDEMADKAERYISKCDPYWDDYWGCFDMAIESFEDDNGNLVV